MNKVFKYWILFKISLFRLRWMLVSTDLPEILFWIVCHFQKPVVRMVPFKNHFEGPKRPAPHPTLANTRLVHAILSCCWILLITKSPSCCHHLSLCNVRASQLLLFAHIHQLTGCCNWSEIDVVLVSNWLSIITWLNT